MLQQMEMVTILSVLETSRIEVKVPITGIVHCLEYRSGLPTMKDQRETREHYWE
jgi:hypothetical protein